MNESRIFGILSIVFGVVLPAAGVILGVVGLCFKEKKVLLNITGIILSVFSWAIFTIVWASIV